MAHSAELGSSPIEKSRSNPFTRANREQLAAQMNTLLKDEKVKKILKTEILHETQVDELNPEENLITTYLETLVN